MNLCGQADVGGKLLGRLLPRILEELQRAVALDAAYDQAGAHRVMGRIYYEAPGWPLSGACKNPGNTSRRRCVCPATSTNHLYLAQPPASRAWPARQELAGAQIHPRAVKPQDLEEDRQEARRLLAEIGWGSPVIGRIVPRRLP